MVSIKEVCLSLVIDINDFNMKLKYVEKFLLKGDKVCVFIWFKGCVIIYKDIGC